MKIITPILGDNQFDGLALPYTFTGTCVTIDRHFIPTTPETDLFSKEHQRHIESAYWAFEYESSTKQTSEHDITLLLLAFSVAHDLNSPFIKFRYSNGDASAARLLTETLTFNPERLLKRHYFDLNKLNQVDTYFQGIREMEVVSQRLTNFIYFSCRAQVCQKWIESFTLLISAIESLVSKNGGHGATKALSERVSNLLADYGITSSMVRDLYNLRSSMVHGRLELPDNYSRNHQHLLELQHVHSLLLQEFVLHRHFEYYRSEEERENWLSSI